MAASDIKPQRPNHLCGNYLHDTQLKLSGHPYGAYPPGPSASESTNGFNYAPQASGLDDDFTLATVSYCLYVLLLFRSC